MRPLLLTAVLLSSTLAAQQRPTPGAARWWQLTSELASDGMQGRDTGTDAYARAAQVVADHFAAAGLQPAGDHGTFFQRVPMHETDLDTDRSSIRILGPGSPPDTLRLLAEVTLSPRANLRPLTAAPLAFIGYGVADGKVDLRGKIAVYFNNTPTGLTPAQRSAMTAARIITLGQSGVVGLVSIDNPAAIEPSHWPTAYARTVTLVPPPPPLPGTDLVGIRISAEAAPRLFAGTAVDPARLLSDAEHGLPLPSLDLARSLQIRLSVTEKDIASPNVLAILPGTDPTLAPEFVALSAHLDGYGFGTPVLGDALYNGALDDAAYVATLLELADTLAHAPAAQRPRRSLLVCIFTGEEKGLLGSEFFTRHPTVPLAQVVADLNLDQLRPIFPLRALTMEGLADSTLGATARVVAAPLHIELRPDREPERNLFRRADNYNFVRAGIPIASFIFGYDPGSPEERIYRDWYARRYHKPQDDLSTPIDWTAAVTFNRFFRDLTLAVADAPTRPTWSSASAYAPKHP